jgi:lysyl-tRNA synthetase class I
VHVATVDEKGLSVSAKAKAQELDGKYDVATKYDEYAKKKEAYMEQKEADLAQARVSAQEMRASASAKAEELDSQYQLREKRAALQAEAAAKKAVAAEVAAAKAAELDGKYQLSAKKEALRAKAMSSGRFSRGLARFAETKAAAAESLAELQVAATVRAHIITPHTVRHRAPRTADEGEIAGCFMASC